MEQPGLIAVAFPDEDEGMYAQMLRATLAHEIAHQWFYAVVATNEFEDAWFDEGITSYLEYLIGEKTGYNSIPLLLSNNLVSYSSMERLFSLSQESKYPINLKSWEYPNQQSYTNSVYGRAWLVLQALDKMSGDSLFINALKDFSIAYKFKHPDQFDFLKFFNDQYDQNLTTFFDQFIYGTSRVDYSIESISYSKNVNDSLDRYVTLVQVERKLDGILPQEITIVLEDGKTQHVNWDGAARLYTAEFKSDSKPDYATLDYNGLYFIDENFNNNSLYLDSNILRLISFEWDMEFIFEFLIAMFL
jgi:aminopeptidase N